MEKALSEKQSTKAKTPSKYTAGTILVLLSHFANISAKEMWMERSAGKSQFQRKHWSKEENFSGREVLTCNIK